MDDDTPVRMRVPDPIPQLLTLAEADVARNALALEREAMAAKTVNPDLDPSEVSRDTKEPGETEEEKKQRSKARVKPGCGHANETKPPKKKPETRKQAAARRAKKVESRKKTAAELRAEVLGV